MLLLLRSRFFITIVNSHFPLLTLKLMVWFYYVAALAVWASLLVWVEVCSSSRTIDSSPGLQMKTQMHSNILLSKYVTCNGLGNICGI